MLPDKGISNRIFYRLEVVGLGDMPLVRKHNLDWLKERRGSITSLIPKLNWKASPEDRYLITESYLNPVTGKN